MRRSGVLRLLATALLCGTLFVQPDTRLYAASGAAGVNWLLVDPATPNTLYVGVAGSFLKRSTDGGATWQYLPDGTVRGMYADNCDDSAGPPTIALDSHDLYTIYSESTDPACRNSTGGLLRSSNGALSFDTLQDNEFVSLATPVVSRRLYAIFTQPSDDYLDQPTCSGVVSSLDQGHVTWRQRGTLDLSNGGNPLSNDDFCPDLIDDPQHPSLLYANTAPPSRSEDGGLTWTAVTAPATTPALHDFALRYDPATGDLLEGVTDDPGVPRDRVFLSADHGRTWTATTCPGAHAGRCPSFVLQNVFGAGAGYAVYPSGIYSFHGVNPAQTEVALGAGWPFALTGVASMQSGAQMGDPVYALLKSGAVYRSADAGKTWRNLDAGMLPTAKPATPPPGSLRAGPYGHAVGAPFIATYRRLGLQIVGYPVDDPYVLQGVLVQDFEHLRLELRNGRVVVGNLGSESTTYIYCGMGSDDPSGFCDNGALPPDTPPAAIFAAFVKQHGGTAIFGTPITGTYKAQNGDGSGRTYTMQLFTKARLEWHPEVHNPTYRILLGLLGPEVLRDQQWL
jgi:hypothetical protein